MAEPNASAANGAATDGAANRQVTIHRIYCRDASLEVPSAPKVFNQQWNPSVDVQVGTQVDTLGDEFFQVTLQLTVTAKLGEEVAYLVEVHQAGIFKVTGFSDTPELQAVLGAYCPNAVFPFAREAVADLIQRGGFPQLLLQPINFDALYLQHVQKAQAEGQIGSPIITS